LSAHVPRRGEDAEDALGIRLARELDEEAPHVHAEERRQQIGVVDVGAVRRVVIATGAGMDADLCSLRRGEPLEDTVVQVDEGVQEALRGIEL
jgi:hypothetical protein